MVLEAGSCHPSYVSYAVLRRRDMGHCAKDQRRGSDNRCENSRRGEKRARQVKADMLIDKRVFDIVLESSGEEY